MIMLEMARDIIRTFLVTHCTLCMELFQKVEPPQTSNVLCEFIRFKSYAKDVALRIPIEYFADCSEDINFCCILYLYMSCIKKMY